MANPVIDWTECPIVRYDPKRLGTAPTIRDWRITPDTIVENFDDGMTVDELHEQFEVPVNDILLILEHASRVSVSAHSPR